MNVVLLFALAACGGAGGSSGGPPPPPPPPPPPVVQPARFLYVYAGGGFSKNGPISPGITGFTVNASTGALTRMPGSPFAVPFAQNAPFEAPLAATPDSKFLYTNGPVTAEYSIGADGALTHLGNFAIPGGHMQMTPSGKFLYTFRGTELGNGEVSGFQITSSGALVPLGQPPLAFSGGAFAAGITPSGKFLYALVEANLAPCVDRCLQIQVVAFTIDPSTGALAAVPGSPFTATDPFALKECDCPDTQRMDIAIDGQGRFLYLPNTINNNIVGFAIDGTTGALSPLPGSPFGPVFSVSGAADPAGKFLFAGGGEKVAVFSIQGSGALTPVPGSPFACPAAERTANELAVDPSGKFLYVRNIGVPGSIPVFSIGADGTLKDVPGSPFQTPEIMGNGPGPFVAVR